MTAEDLHLNNFRSQLYELETLVFIGIAVLPILLKLRLVAEQAKIPSNYKNSWEWKQDKGRLMSQAFSNGGVAQDLCWIGAHPGVWLQLLALWTVSLNTRPGSPGKAINSGNAINSLLSLNPIQSVQEASNNFSGRG